MTEKNDSLPPALIQPPIWFLYGIAFRDKNTHKAVLNHALNEAYKILMWNAPTTKPPT